MMGRTERTSNIELLRIVSMLMVLNVHTFWAPTDLTNANIWDGRIIFDFLRESASISCVNLFVIISGYFSIKWKARSISSLIFQVYFWIFIVLLGVIIFSDFHFSLKDFALYGMGIMTCYWFIPAYIGLYLMAPMMNSFVENSSKKQLLWYIIAFYFYFSIDSMPFSTNYSQNGYSIFSFCGLYLVGRYLKKSNITDIGIFKSKKFIFISVLVVTLLIVAEAIGFSYFFKRGGVQLISSRFSPFAYNNPLVIFQTILIFILFLKLNIRSKIINWCSVSALSIYLLHMHPALKQDFYAFTQSLYHQSVLIQYTSIFLLILCVILIAIPIDKLRILIFNLVYPKVSSKLKRQLNLRNGIN